MLIKSPPFKTYSGAAYLRGSNSRHVPIEGTPQFLPRHIVRRVKLTELVLECRTSSDVPADLGGLA